ncbi:hypothetical protein [Streptantibioticus ferralitis]|uniref:Uncharacterized protein n=1 Tax=Streptantibioticus ferralitis TaxID=236510 RepID=A0ABT5Z4T1_9ACTN|nr:hypothetical protein [Streptantibioticus ferralitis]MDF2258832.1 hypothetical protein [Streptantibioticus ferralitis]
MRTWERQATGGKVRREAGGEAGGHVRGAQAPDAAEFWSHLRGWRLNIQADGAVHQSCGDNQVLIPQLAKAVGMSDEDLRGWIGTLDPAHAVRIWQAYPLAFFDLHLRH